MSSVTNVILTFSVCEERSARMCEVNAVFEDEPSFGGTLDERDYAYGGGTVLECEVAVGAFNYLPLSDFLAHLRTVDWREPDRVQLFVKGPDDSIFVDIDWRSA